MSMKLSAPRQDVIRIAIPMASGLFCEHFGSARQFQLYEGQREWRLLEGVGLFDAPEHKPGSLPRWLKEQGVGLVVVSAIGERALKIFENACIDVCLAEGPRAPEQLAHAALAGRFETATMLNTRCHDHDHDHGDHCHSH